MRLLPDWIESLTLQQQAVLILPCRGPDGFPKNHGSKPVLQYYRAAVFKAAQLGRMLELGENAGTLMTLQGFESRLTWGYALRQFQHVEDELPLHFYTHLMHGAEVIGYKHPDRLFRDRWMEFYLSCCNYLHVEPEDCLQMERRLNDFGRPGDVIIRGEMA